MSTWGVYKQRDKRNKKYTAVWKDYEGYEGVKLERNTNAKENSFKYLWIKEIMSQRNHV